MATPELRHMLRDDDLNHEEQKQVLELAIKFHKNRFYHQPFAGPQGIAVLFDKPSTRTRSSFSIGIAELGGYPLVIDKSGSQLGRGEPVADTARVLDRMAYGVVWRTFGQDRVEEMAEYSTHPVVNALTDELAAPTAETAVRLRLTQALIELPVAAAAEALRRLARDSDPAVARLASVFA